MHEMITSNCTWRNFMNDPAYNTRNVTPQDLCRLKEDLQRLFVLPVFRSYLGAEVFINLR